jgi:hypothetical protein
VPTEFPFVEIPEELEAIVGKRDPGTRMYRRDGSQEESSVWFDYGQPAVASQSGWRAITGKTYAQSERSSQEASRQKDVTK